MLKRYDIIDHADIIVAEHGRWCEFTAVDSLLTVKNAMLEVCREMIKHQLAEYKAVLNLNGDIPPALMKVIDDSFNKMFDNIQKAIEMK
jgi:hypothetical protein